MLTLMSWVARIFTDHWDIMSQQLAFRSPKTKRKKKIKVIVKNDEVIWHAILEKNQNEWICVMLSHFYFACRTVTSYELHFKNEQCFRV